MSKPTPTFDGCQTQNFPTPRLPHSTSARCKILQHLQDPVGAGLLAKASIQSTSSLNALPPS
ncbi:hypothetical protein CXF97_14340 [Pseudomonas sp. Choline-02u-1]|nr:hypothetical protein CXF97_14340 [Pseudomonas sp. Choline-02u-1]